MARSLTCGLSLSLLVVSPARAQHVRDPYSDNTLFVHLDPEFRPDDPIVEVMSRMSGARAVYWFDLVPGLAVWEVEPAEIARAQEVLSAFSGVRRVERDRVGWTLQSQPNDPWYGEEWWSDNTGQTVNGVTGTIGADIHALSAWATTTNGSGVIVAVIDTGVNYLHADLASNIWTNPGEIPGDGIDNDGNGWVDDIHGIAVDYMPPSSDLCLDPYACGTELFCNNQQVWWGAIATLPYDVQGPSPRSMSSTDPGGHGTAVASTIGAKGNNGQYLAGVAWTARVMPIRAINNCRCSTETGWAKAFDHAWKMGAKIVNCSFGGPDAFSQSLFSIFQAANNNGMLIVVSAGNVGRNIELPGQGFWPPLFNLSNHINVAATTQTDGLAAFSNWGPTVVHLGAPGVNIVGLSPIHNQNDCYWRYWDGTSFAAPQVSGAAALIWTQHPTWTAAQVKQQLLCSVRPVTTLQGKCVTGGVLDLKKAVQPSCP